MDKKWTPTKSGKHGFEMADLRLDLDSAIAGKTWLLLPEGFRDEASGDSYPLPRRTEDLQRLAVIPFPPRKKDAGCHYIRRAIKLWRARQTKKNSAMLDMGTRSETIKREQDSLLNGQQ